MNILSYILIGLFFISLGHFVYESIIAPTLRLAIRYELFELRDQLRDLKIKYADKFDEEAFSLLEVGLHNSIIWTHTLTLSRMFEISGEVSSNQGLRQRMKRRSEIIESCEIKETREIAMKMGRMMRRAYIINSGVFFLPFLPFFGLYKCIEGMRSWNGLIKSIVFLPEKDVERISHTTYTGKYGHVAL